MINRLLMWITGFLRVRVIDVNGRPYLERYDAGTWLGVDVYLHRFVSCDGERWLHDLPWRWSAGVVLAGGYTEERLAHMDPSLGMLIIKRTVRWLNLINERTFHRIASVLPGTWTLFLHGPRIKGWGFITELPDKDVHGSQAKYFCYEQPFTGERTEDMISNAPTGRELRQQQEQQAMVDWVNRVAENAPPMPPVQPCKRETRSHDHYFSPVPQYRKREQP